MFDHVPPQIFWPLFALCWLLGSAVATRLV